MKRRFIIFLLTTPIVALANRAAVISTINHAADQVGVSRELLVSICGVETSYNPQIRPHKDGSSLSHGLCQVKEETALFMDQVYKHKMGATVARLQNPYISAFYAAKYLKYQLNRYDGNVAKAVTAYNKGHATTGNSRYYRKVMALLNE